MPLGRLAETLRDRGLTEGMVQVVADNWHSLGVMVLDTTVGTVRMGVQLMASLEGAAARAPAWAGAGTGRPPEGG